MTLRIAVVGPTHPYKGGIAQHTTMLCHQLAAAGHEVELVSWREQYPALLYPGQQRVPDDQPEVPVYPRTVHELSWRRPDGWLRTGRRLGRAADVVVTVVVTPVQAPAYAALLRAARRAGASTVALVHNVLPHERRSIDRPLMRTLFGSVDGVLVHAPEQADLVADLSRAPVEVVPLPAFFPVHEGAGVPAEAREEPVRRLLFFGFVRPYKGVDVLLEALAKVPDVSLVIAGEVWGGVEPLQGRIDELALRDRVDLRPEYVPTSEVPNLFAECDALVLPYLSGIVSTNVLVAHAHGVPVIATALPAFAARLTDGVDGLLCRPDDAEDLARAIHQLYEPGRLAQLRAGIQPVDDDVEWKDYVAALLRAGGSRRREASVGGGA